MGVFRHSPSDSRRPNSLPQDVSSTATGFSPSIPLIPLSLFAGASGEDFFLPGSRGAINPFFLLCRPSQSKFHRSKDRRFPRKSLRPLLPLFMAETAFFFPGSPSVEADIKTYSICFSELLTATAR